MNNKCPKCNEKLSPFYMKQTCPKCNTNLVYYDLDKRLEADHEKAMREQAAVDRVLNNIKTSAFGGAVQIIRFVTMFSPLLWMCLPMFIVRDLPNGGDNSMSGEAISLLSILMGIISKEIAFDELFSNGIYFATAITVVCIIIFSLTVIISSLFSVGEKALKRNMSFSTVNFIVLLGCTIWCMIECNPSLGIIITIVVYILEFFLHKLVDKKINQPTNE